MFNTGAGGRVTVSHASEALACQVSNTQVIDVSSATPLSSYIILCDPECDRVILECGIHYVANGAGSAGTVNIGTRGDTDSIVDAYSTSVSTSAQDTYASMTLATTLKGTAQKTGGLPVVPAGSPVYVNVSQGASNTGDFVISIRHAAIEPGV